MNINNIRFLYLKYFIFKNYKLFNHSRLSTLDNEDLLFVNSGMVQFKKNFLNFEENIFNKIVSIQPCLRVSGKHNDLDDIEKKKNHHTFFEMLGNFSFSKSSKLETIFYNWELLTKFYKIPKNKLYVTVYYKDCESYNIWLNFIKIPISNLIKVYDKDNLVYNSDNFWIIDNFGLCGSSTEVFYKLKNSSTFSKNKNYFIELFNIVFIKYNKNSNGFQFLSNFSIDVGWGLERLVSTIEKKNSNYKINLFFSFILEISFYIKFFNLNHNFLKVIADHLRTCIFLFVDNIIPSNNRRGYILKQILRRIISRYLIIGINYCFLYNLVEFFIKKMFYYKYLLMKIFYIKKVIFFEERNYLNFLLKKKKILKEKLIINNILKNKNIYNLYNTLGFPMDIIFNMFKNLGFNSSCINKKFFYIYFIYSLSKKIFFN